MKIRACGVKCLPIVMDRRNLPIMPVYVYEVIRPDGSAGERFELRQALDAAAITQHPLTGEPVRRVICAPSLNTRHTPGKTRARLENKQLAKAGFTKYERDKLTGTYHRVTGSGGPESFRRPS
jgi:predicted nucleic acid-binding Zn ribbon protein